MNLIWLQLGHLSCLGTIFRRALLFFFKIVHFPVWNEYFNFVVVPLTFFDHFSLLLSVKIEKSNLADQRWWLLRKSWRQSDVVWRHHVTLLTSNEHIWTYYILSKFCCESFILLVRWSLIRPRSNFLLRSVLVWLFLNFLSDFLFPFILAEREGCVTSSKLINENYLLTWAKATYFVIV